MSSGSSFGLPPPPLASTSMTLTGFPMGSSSSASGPGLPQHHQQSQQHHQQPQQQPQQQQQQQQQYQSSALGPTSGYTDRHSKPGGLGFLNGNHHDGQNGMGSGESGGIPGCLSALFSLHLGIPVFISVSTSTSIISTSISVGLPPSTPTYLYPPLLTFIYLYLYLDVNPSVSISIHPRPLPTSIYLPNEILRKADLVDSARLRIGSSR